MDLLLTLVPGPLTDAQIRSLQNVLVHAGRLDEGLLAAAEALDALGPPPPAG